MLGASATLISSIVRLRDEVPILKQWGRSRFGSISYSIYMLHLVIILFAQILWHKLFHYQTGGGLLYQTPKLVGDLWGMGILLATCVAGWFSFRFIETPARTRIRRWFGEYHL